VVELFDTNTAENVMTQNYKWVKENDSLEKVLPLFDRGNDVLLVLDKDKKYSGVLTERMILRSGMGREKTMVNRC